MYEVVYYMKKFLNKLGFNLAWKSLKGNKWNFGEKKKKKVLPILSIPLKEIGKMKWICQVTDTKQVK